MAATMTKPKSTKKTNPVSIRPLHDKIIVRRDEAEGKTESGIFLPESSKERPKTGIVESVGDGKLNTETGDRTPLTVKKGDRIIFTSYAGTEIKLDGEELLIMSEDEVLAVID